jgi:serine/threonine protein kinase
MSTTELDVSALGRLTPLGRGGTATVYFVPGLQLPEFPGERFVYKKYNDRTIRLAGQALGHGLTNFVQFRDRLPEEQQRAWDARIIWPVAVVKNRGGAAEGIIMRLIPDRYFHDFKKREGGVNRKPREIETLFGDTETALRKGLPDVQQHTRLQLLRAIAGAYAMMHKENVVLGDISGRNIIYDPDPKQPSIMVVDVDSARVKGNRATFGIQPHTPNWQPPEALRASAELERGKVARPPMSVDAQNRLHNLWSIQSVKTDVYKFGLMTVRILDYGRGCAVNRDPARARKILVSRLGNAAGGLLDASMAPDPNDRPTMREWYLLFQGGGAANGAKPIVQQQPSTKPAPALPDGYRRGNWQWKAGKGWVRVARP